MQCEIIDSMWWQKYMPSLWYEAVMSFSKETGEGDCCNALMQYILIAAQNNANSSQLPCSMSAVFYIRPTKTHDDIQ